MVKTVNFQRWNIQMNYEGFENLRQGLCIFQGLKSWNLYYWPMVYAIGNSNIGHIVTVISNKPVKYQINQ